MLPEICICLQSTQILCVKKFVNHGRLSIPRRILFPRSDRVFFPLYEDKIHNHSKSQALYLKLSNKSSRSPKIRTYIDYEKDFVNFSVKRCYWCYAVAASIATAICFEVLANMTASKTFNSIFNISKDQKPKQLDVDEIRNSSSQGGTKAKPFYWKRFQSFASLDVNGKWFMTPRDFLDSVIDSDDEVKTKIRRRKVSLEEVGFMLHRVPRIYEEAAMKNAISSNPQLFRSLGAHGLISYNEYLFLLSLATRPKRGIRHAFDVIDTSKEGSVMKSEFTQFVTLATAKRFEKFSTESEAHSTKKRMKVSATVPDDSKKVYETTLLVHFFGRTNASGIYHDLKYDEFSAFIQGFQREILLSEFEAYSRGHDVIAEEDFAELFLKYTDFNIEESKKRRARLMSLPAEQSPGITFRDFELFCRLLNNLEDLTVAIKYISVAGRPLSRQEFKRAANVCLDGQDISSHLINTIFVLFGSENGDNYLSIDEFTNVMRNRLKRRVGVPINRTWSWQSFKKCFRQSLKEQRKMPKQPI